MCLMCTTNAPVISQRGRSAALTACPQKMLSVAGAPSHIHAEANILENKVVHISSGDSRVQFLLPQLCCKRLIAAT